eukprot:3332903-Alexandrium_andersonii.AAC.1
MAALLVPMPVQAVLGSSQTSPWPRPGLRPGCVLVCPCSQAAIAFRTASWTCVPHPVSLLVLDLFDVASLHNPTIAIVFRSPLRSKAQQFDGLVGHVNGGFTREGSASSKDVVRRVRAVDYFSNMLSMAEWLDCCRQTISRWERITCTTLS